MGLDSMESVTTGVSKQGMSDVLNDIRLHLAIEAKEALEQHAIVTTALRNAWSGEDCENFCKNFENMAKEVADALDEYYRQIAAKLDEIYENWEAFQSSNVTGG